MGQRGMRRLGVILSSGLIGAGMSAIAGCASAPPDRAAWAWRRAALERETFTVRSPDLVLGAPRALHGPAAGGAVRPWWISRNDARLNVRDGGRVGERTRYIIHIENTQRSFPGAIHNTYRRTFETTRYGRGVR